MTSRFTYGGDEHLLVECSEEMSIDAFFKSLTAGRLIAERAISGVTEICAGNASYLVRYDPDRVHPRDLLREVEAIDAEADREPPRLDTRIVEVPVYYGGGEPGHPSLPIVDPYRARGLGYPLAR